MAAQSIEKVTKLAGYAMLGGGYATVLADPDDVERPEVELYDVLPKEAEGRRGSWEIVARFVPEAE